MPHAMPVFNELLILLLVSIPIAIIFDRLRLPVIIGFMITGVLIGPFGFGLIRDVGAVESLAEIGVVLLLFTIGLEFSVRRIVDMKRLVLWGGGLQVVLTTLLVIGITYLLGRPFRQEVFFGFLFALSSTAPRSNHRTTRHTLLSSKHRDSAWLASALVGLSRTRLLFGLDNSPHGA